MKIVVIHYHLRRGGVTRVISHACQAMRSAGHEVVVLCGEEPSSSFDFDVRVVSGLGYLDINDTVDSYRLVSEIIKIARESFSGDPDRWHIHNHSLGKNGAISAGICHLAKVAPVLLQIHDFAEDGRPKNYNLLRSQMDSLDDLYPYGDSIHYAVLNSRDYQLLNEAGLPLSNLHMLPNAVDVPQLDSDPMPLNILIDKPLILYPTRAIRRKNIGEALLLSVLNSDYHFASTLHPENPTARLIYEDWKVFSKEMGISFVFGLGEREFSFADIMNQAKVILTTSIAEGFGLAFLEPFLFDKGIVGRDLASITEDFKEKGIDLGNLYSELLIPLSWINIDALMNTMLIELKSRAELFGEPFQVSVQSELKESLIRGDKIDFGKLPEHFQKEVIIKVINEPGLGEEIEGGKLIMPDDEQIAENRKIIERTMNLKAYQSHLEALYEQLKPYKLESIKKLPSKQVLQQFMKPDCFNILSS